MDKLDLSLIPSKEQIQQLPVFQNLAPNQIQLISKLEQCHALQDELFSTPLFGFDSESKPTFRKGEVATGPHVIQLATADQAYVFQISPAILDFLTPIFENPEQLKVGFGLKNDAHLFRKKGIHFNQVLDLAKAFTAFGITTPVGVKNAMALLFQVNFPKSKSVSTSNWSKFPLSTAQIQYAAADAYAPVLIYQELQRLGITLPAAQHRTK
jgi:ribonuclease D